MAIKDYTLYKIERDLNQIEHINLPQNIADLEAYMQKLIAEIEESNNFQEFEYLDPSAGFAAKIRDLFTNFDSAAEFIANKLLVTEIETKEQYSQFSLQKGVLFQAVIENQGKKSIILAKVDHDQFLDITRESIEFRDGLAVKKKIFKAALIEFDNSQIITSIHVYDSNTTIAKFWSHDFLALSEKRTKKHNTEISYTEIRASLGRNVQRKSPQDHMILSNSLTGFYFANQTFSIEEYIQNSLLGYTPIKSDVDIPGIIEKIKELPQKKNFDTRFEIDRSAIKFKPYKIELADHLFLSIEGEINSLDAKVFPEKDQEGKKFLRIRTDKGYDHFRPGSD